MKEAVNFIKGTALFSFGLGLLITLLSAHPENWPKDTDPISAIMVLLLVACLVGAVPFSLIVGAHYLMKN